MKKEKEIENEIDHPRAPKMRCNHTESSLIQTSLTVQIIPRTAPTQSSRKASWSSRASRSGTNTPSAAAAAAAASSDGHRRTQSTTAIDSEGGAGAFS